MESSEDAVATEELRQLVVDRWGREFADRSEEPIRINAEIAARIDAAHDWAPGASRQTYFEYVLEEMLPNAAWFFGPRGPGSNRALERPPRRPGATLAMLDRRRA